MEARWHGKSGEETVQSGAADATESIDQAVITSASKPITFDFDGVSKHLKNSEQVAAFRECVVKPGPQAALPFEKQAELAAHFVEMAKEQTTANGKEEEDLLKAYFIRDNFHIIYVEHRKYESKLEKEQAALLAKDDAMARVRRYQDDCEGVASSARRER